MEGGRRVFFVGKRQRSAAAPANASAFNGRELLPASGEPDLMPSVDHKLPPGWTRHWSSARRRWFFRHMSRGISMWDWPSARSISEALRKAAVSGTPGASAPITAAAAADVSASPGAAAAAVPEPEDGPATLDAALDVASGKRKRDSEEGDVMAEDGDDREADDESPWKRRRRTTPEVPPAPANTAQAEPSAVSTVASAGMGSAFSVPEPQEPPPRVGLDADRTMPPDAVVKLSRREMHDRNRVAGRRRAEFDHEKFVQAVPVESLGLAEDVRAVWDANPHVQQVFANHRQLVTSDKWLGLSDRVVGPDTPRSRYQRRRGEAKTVMQSAARGHFLAAVEFLTTHAKDGDVVLCVGAAMGRLFNFLATTMFPSVRIVVIDPSPFNVLPSANLEVHACQFDQEIAAKFVGHKGNVLLISDAKLSELSMSIDQAESFAADVMQQQMTWVLTVRPRAALLRFRLPYTVGETYYLQGTLFFPIYASPTSAESRLAVSIGEDGQYTEVAYDHSRYEDVMFHFNTVTRTTLWPAPLGGLFGTEPGAFAEAACDRCYDCAAERYVLERFAREARKPPSPSPTTAGADVSERSTEAADSRPIAMAVQAAAPDPCSAAVALSRQVTAAARKGAGAGVRM